MSVIERQKADECLDRLTDFRINCHEITWTSSQRPSFIQAGGNLFFLEVPYEGTTPHCHDFAEILFVNSGKMIHCVNGDRQRVGAGNIIFMRPDDVHFFLPDVDHEKVEVVLLDFDLELFLSLSVYFENDSFLHQLTASVLPPTFMMDPVAASSFYVSLLKLNSAGIHPQLRKIKLKIMLGELFSHFFIDEVNLLSEAQVPDWLEELCSTMRREENFKGGVERMQKLACCTPGHLCKCFQRYLGKTPTAFVNELKLNHAARLLEDSSMEITSIANSLNFKSLSRFYHLFKSYFGVTPFVYRRKKVRRQSF